MNNATPRFVDIHAHLLPGIDDGPRDLKAAIAMARAAREAGTAALIASPHLRSDFPDVDVHEIAGRCQELRQALAQEEIRLTVVPAAEVSLVWALEASAEELKLASYGGVGRDLLIEAPETTLGGGLDQLIYQVRTHGFRVTLGHPERTPDFQDDASQLEELVRQGVLLQVNARALLPRRGSRIHHLARDLCKKGLVHAIASDGHDAGSRRPVTVLPAAFEEASTLVGSEYATWMLRDAPAAIIAGAELPDPPELSSTSGRLARIFSH